MQYHHIAQMVNNLEQSVRRMIPDAPQSLHTSISLPVSQFMHDVVDDGSDNDTKYLRILGELTSTEASSVAVCSDSFDIDGPNCKITCNAEWTEWKDMDFDGKTRLQCLESAVDFKREMMRAGPAVSA